MDKRDSIAILIAVYNGQALLQRTLDSIVDDCSLTIVVVDDGSATPICRKQLFYSGDVIMLRHAINRGHVAALNTGLKYILENGYEYMARLDAGDVAAKGRFSLQREFLMKHPQYGLVGSKIREIGNHESALVDLPSEQLKRRLHIRSEFGHPAVMLTVSAIKEIGLYDNQFGGMEDWDYWLRLAMKYEVKNLPEVLTELDGTPGSISRDLKYIIRVKRRFMKVRVLWRHFAPGYLESYFGLFSALFILAVNLVIPPKVIMARVKTGKSH